MKIAKVIFLTISSTGLLALLMFFSASMTAQTNDLSGRSTVSVRAIYQDTERPVRRAAVQIFSEDLPRVSRQGVTDARGEFSFKNVPAGQYRVNVGFPGFTNGFAGYDHRNAVLVDVDGTSNVEVKIRAERAAAITGKITYPDGEPAIGAQINIFRKSGKRWEHASIVSAGAQTDDRGIYRIYPLPPGEYVIGVIEQSLVIEERDGGTMQTTGNKSLNPYYYGGGSNHSTATVIQVDAGREVNNINITLAERATYKVAGTIAASGMPMAGAYLRLQPYEDGLSGPTLMIPYGLTAQASKDGQWSFSDVPDGNYNVELDQTGSRFAYNGESKKNPRLVGQRQLVTVTGADVSGIVISLTEGGQVSGSIVVEGDKPLPRGGQVSLQPVTRHISQNYGSVSLEPWAKGQFLIDGVSAGQHLLTVQIWDKNYFVKSVTWTDRDLLRQPLKVTEGGEVKNVRIVLSRDVGIVSGRLVSAEDKNPLGGALFTLVPSDDLRWARTDSFIFGYTDKKGAFKVTGAPGEYILIMQRRNAEPVTTIDYIRERAAGPRVSLKPGEQSDIEIAISPK
jgi:carboxypeptidase family protein